MSVMSGCGVIIMTGRLVSADHSGINLCQSWQSELQLSPVLRIPGNGVTFEVDSLDSSCYCELFDV